VRRSTRTVRAAAVVAVGAVVLVASGFTVVKDPDVAEPIVWPSNTVTVVVHNAGTGDVTDGSDIEAVQRALEAWSADCADFSFTYGGTTGTTSASNDGTNLIVWRENGDPALSGAVATAIRRRNTSGAADRWSDVDILMNGRDQDGFRWSTQGHPQRFDVGHVVTHELGHLLGLQHAANPEATMYYGGTRGHTYGRTLHPDDIAGLCFLYPAGAFSCGDDGDCPLLDGFYGGGDVRTRCSGGSCTQGSASYGADCFAPGHCVSGACVDDPRNSSNADPGWCSVACTVGGNDCPGDDLCTDAAGTALCALGRDNCLFDSNCAVDANDVCPLDLDGRYRCRDLCVLDNQCDGEARCHGGTGDNPPGFCRQPGTADLGAACEDGYDCASMSCAGSTAVASCVADPLGPADPGPDPEPGVEPDPEPSMNPDPEPGVEPDPEPGMEPDPEPSMNPDPEPSPVVDAGAQPDPEPSVGPDTMPDVIPYDGERGGGCNCRAVDASSAGLLGLFGLVRWRRRWRR
jgi:MYXO-CTERM domain-containing protein